MNHYEVLKVGKSEQERINEIFYNLNQLTLEVFRSKKWNTLYIESRPFIDADSYEYFETFFSYINESQFTVLDYPLHRGEKFLRFNNLPNFSIFDEAMNEYDFRSTGGVAFGASLKWAIHSDPDNHVLFFGYSEEFESKVREIFLTNEFVITRNQVNDIYEKHKEFLKGNSV